MWDKNKAQEHLYRHLGEFHDKLTIDVNVAIQATVETAKQILGPELQAQFLEILGEKLGIKDAEYTEIDDDEEEVA